MVNGKREKGHVEIEKKKKKCEVDMLCRLFVFFFLLLLLSTCCFSCCWTLMCVVQMKTIWAVFLTVCSLFESKRSTVFPQQPSRTWHTRKKNYRDLKPVLETCVVQRAHKWIVWFRFKRKKWDVLFESFAPVCPRENPKERESLSYKRGHFEKQWEARYNTISVLAFSMVY